MIKHILLNLTIFFTFLTTSNIAAQNRSVMSNVARFTTYLSEQGFKQNSVRSLAIDSRGVVWCATMQGIVSFDGYDFVTYRRSVDSSNTLINNIVNLIYVDYFDCVWAVTSKGVSIFNPMTGRYTQVVIPNDVEILSICFDEERREVIFGTSSGLYGANYASVDDDIVCESLPTFNDSPKPIRRVTKIQRAGGYWFVMTTLGAFYAPDKGELEQIFLDMKVIRRQKDNKISVYMNVAESDSGEVWMMSRWDISRFDETGKTQEVYSNNVAMFSSMLCDSQGMLWLGTRRLGVARYDTKSGECRFFDRENGGVGLKSNQINKIAADRFGVLWIATARGGLSKYYNTSNPFMHFVTKATGGAALHNNVDGICEQSDGVFWVAPLDDGLDRVVYDRASGLYSSQSLFKGKGVVSVKCDSAGRIYCGVKGEGLYSFRYEGGAVRDLRVENFGGLLKSSSRFVSDIEIDDRGVMWVSVSGGDGAFIRYLPLSHNGEGEFIIYDSYLNHSDDSNLGDVDMSLIARNGDIWLVSEDNGLSRVSVDPESGKVRCIQKVQFKTPSGKYTSFDMCFHIAQDVDDYLYLTTFGSGVVRFYPPVDNKVDEFEVLDVSRGLADNVTYASLCSDNGDMWISSNNGLSQYLRGENRIINYNVGDGLQDNNFRRRSYAKGASGVLYFGGINGVTAFDPSEIERSESAPYLYISQLKVMNSVVHPQEELYGRVILQKDISQIERLELRHTDRTFTLKAVAVHHIKPLKNRYKYMLEGFDTEWILSPYANCEVSYTNLPAGNYIFKVMAANCDGVWSSEPTTLSIRVLPPWWRSSIAYLFYILTLLFAGYQYKMYLVRREKQRYEEELKAREIENIININKSRVNFFAELSCEFIDPLTLIVGPIGDIISAKMVFPDFVNDNLRLAKVNCDKLLILLNQLEEFKQLSLGEVPMDIKHIDVVALLRESFESFERSGLEDSIAIQLNSSVESLVMDVDGAKLSTIFYNMLCNSLKMSRSNSNVTISIASSCDIDSDAYWAVKGESQRWLWLSIQSCGDILREADLSKLFEYHSAPPKGLSKQSSLWSIHSDLGLDILSQLVEKMGGRLGVTSKNGVTTLIFALPIGDDVERVVNETPVMCAERVLEVESSEEDVDEKADSGDETLPLVLIVEDDEDMRHFLSGVLAKNHRSIFADTAEQAYKSMLAEFPDLVISKVRLAGESGLELCNKIRGNELINHIPIVIISDELDRMDAFSAKADLQISKPFEAEYFRLRIGNLIESRRLLHTKYKNSFVYTSKPTSGMNEQDAKFVADIEKIIQENLSNQLFSIDAFSTELPYSRMQVYRKLKLITGFSANEFVRMYRLKRAEEFIRSGEYKITEVIYMVGFSNKSYFSKCFKALFNLTPKEYQEHCRRVEP